MARIGDITVDLTDDFRDLLNKTCKELQDTREALSEERIRAIVREELIAHDKHALDHIRLQLGAQPV